MKRITRTVKMYRYTIYAVTMDQGTPTMEPVGSGITVEELPKEKALVAEFREDFPDEKRALVVVINEGTEQKYTMPIEKFIREAEEI